MSSKDQKTADKFSNSWNNVFDKSVYSEAQITDWIEPWKKEDLAGKKVLELGCGSGAIMAHLVKSSPSLYVGVDLGDSVNAARELMGDNAVIEKADIADYSGIKEKFGLFDNVYCIGVIHHMSNPADGFESVLNLTKPGGRFHCWVYAYEGNLPVRIFVEPLRKIVNHLPWYVTKYLIALPLALPFYMYSKFCRFLSNFLKKASFLPLFDYMKHISQRGFNYHHHIAFDQLVTPVTHFMKKETLERWLEDDRIEKDSVYLIFRNRNGWKFGGVRK